MTDRNAGASPGSMDLRDPDLWKGVPSDEMWRRWKARIEAQVTDLFRPDRPRAIANVRTSGLGPSERSS